MTLALALASLAAAGSVQQVRVLDQSGKPLVGAVVFISSPSALPERAGSFVLDQVDTEFVPHLLVVPAGSSVRFPNKDNIQHHLYSFSSAKPFELPLYRGEPAAPLVFEKPGLVKLGCNIHDWMLGFILVIPTESFVVTDAQGRGELAAPPGAELAVFHERAKATIASTRRAAAESPEIVWKLPSRAAGRAGKPSGY